MPKTDAPESTDETKLAEKPKVKAKRLTIKNVWSEMEALKQSLTTLEARTSNTGQILEGLVSKIESTRSAPPSDAQIAQQVASISTGMQSLNGNYLRQVEEQSNLGKEIKGMGTKVDSLIAGVKLVEESCGAVSIDVDALKESIDKTAKKAESLEAQVGKLEGNLKRALWVTCLATGGIVIVVIIAALFFL